MVTAWFNKHKRDMVDEFFSGTGPPVCYALNMDEHENYPFSLEVVLLYYLQFGYVLKRRFTPNIKLV